MRTRNPSGLGDQRPDDTVGVSGSSNPRLDVALTDQELRQGRCIVSRERHAAKYDDRSTLIGLAHH